MKLLAVAVLLAGCASIRDFHSVSTRIAKCDLTSDDQIEAVDVRTGYPLLSTPHRYSCFIGEEGQVTWVVENASEASLETFSDLPTTVIEQAVPKATIGY